MSSPAFDVVNVNWGGVPYFNAAGSSTSFDVVFDATAGAGAEIVELSNLSGIDTTVLPSGTSLDFLLHITPGGPGGATDPGTMVFPGGGGGSAAAPTDMLYDFGLGVHPTTLTQPLPPNQIIFAPDGAGNYLWATL